MLQHVYWRVSDTAIMTRRKLRCSDRTYCPPCQHRTSSESVVGFRSTCLSAPCSSTATLNQDLAIPVLYATNSTQPRHRYASLNGIFVHDAAFQGLHSINTVLYPRYYCFSALDPGYSRESLRLEFTECQDHVALRPSLIFQPIY